MTSHYDSDPSVPPARVEHLGRRRSAPARGTDGLRLPSPAKAQDPGPSYDDFLDHAEGDESA
jgi:hypothetical protein